METALLFEWIFFGGLRFDLYGTGFRYGFEFLNYPAVLHFPSHYCALEVYVDCFFFFTPGSRVLEVLHFKSAFVTMWALDNLTDTVCCHGS